MSNLQGKSALVLGGLEFLQAWTNMLTDKYILIMS